MDPIETMKEACRAIGRCIALRLLGVLAELAGAYDPGKVAMCYDREDKKSMGALLCWLRKWKRNPIKKSMGTTSRSRRFLILGRSPMARSSLDAGGDRRTRSQERRQAIESLEKDLIKKFRHLGVAIPILKEIGNHVEKGAEIFGELKGDCRMIQVILLTGIILHNKNWKVRGFRRMTRQ